MTEQAKQTSRPLTSSVTGTVGRVSGNKTIKVMLDRLVQDRIYGKYVKHRTTLSVHDPESAARAGDTVEVAQCRPVSKTKSWRLVRVVKQAQTV